MNTQSFPLDTHKIGVFLWLFWAWPSSSRLVAHFCQFVCGCKIPLNLLLSLNRAALSLLVDMIEGGPDLVEFREGSEKKLLVFKHANSVIWLHSYVNWIESRVNCWPASVHKLRLETVLFYTVFNCISVVVIRSLIKLEYKPNVCIDFIVVWRIPLFL